jgi:hypothetical protein
MTVKIVLKKRDTLSKHGYAARISERKRRKALRGAVKEHGHLYVIRKLNVLYIYNKNRHPDLAEIFRGDMKFVQRLRDRLKDRRRNRTPKKS